MSDYDWLDKKSLRSVDQLRLWADNPRLDPEEKHISLSDFASDLITQNGEKKKIRGRYPFILWIK